MLVETPSSDDIFRFRRENFVDITLCERILRI
jgi:hypothetical protein